MHLYVGFEKESAPIGILMADTEEKAWLAFTAMKEDIQIVEELDINELQTNADFGVVFLLTSEKRKLKRVNGEPSVMFRKWRRGLK